MASRLELHEILKGILGSNNVYYQPPESFKMGYPCIVYERYNNNAKFADNKIYNSKRSYSLTYIDKNPDSDVMLDKILKLPYCRFDRHFTIDNLNHDVFILFF